ncbi:MAG TPA: right-handed parallel beta-helix repeat-containing protein [archaeon]|nr:right-handed parallel beta-helix repeat-containing protein [archaeon]
MRNIKKILIVFLLFALASALPSVASGNGIKVKDLELYPTFECIGLRLAYEGDSDSNAVACVRYRLKGTDLWREAQNLCRIKDNRFAGSIFFLNPGTGYEVEITVTDPGGVSGGKKVVPVVTRSDRFPAGGGREYYVDPAGDDRSDGTVKKPFRTIQKAADLSGPGDVVWVMPGLYREQVNVTRSGKLGAYISFMARGKGVILSGADQKYESPDEKNNWLPESEDVYATDPGYRTRFVSADGVRLYHYISRDEFEEFVCGEPGGWYQDQSSGRLYVRLSSGDDPDDRLMQVAALDAGFWLRDADYILIEGFEIRDYGRETGGAGIHLDKSAWCVVRNCSVHGMQSQIQLSGPEAEGNLVEACELWDTSIPRWPWAMTKGHDEEGGGVMSTGGRGNVVRGCRMHGLFDGLAPSYWDKLWDEAYNCDWDVCDNEIYDIRDDIIEPEGPCINFRFWNNYCHDLFTGVSLAPINVGPTYVLYNAMYNLSFKNLKYSGNSPGTCIIYHNTFYSEKTVHHLITLSRPFQAQVFRNNIFCSTAYALWSRRALPANNDIDYNDWYSLDLEWFKSYTGLKRPRLFQVDGKDLFTLKEIQQTLGWEVHGLNADPLFVAPGSGDFRLKVNSPCLDRGQNLPNINDGFKGKAPDMGAYEWGSENQGPFPLGCRRY